MKSKISFYLILLTSLAFTMSACSSDDDPKDDTVKANCSISFCYDLNMLNSDEFAKEVSSVAVWAFDKNGKLAWSHTENAQNAFSNDFSVEATLPVGEYDFVTWCGLTSDMPLIPTLTPSSISQLTLSLPIESNVCNAELPAIFNASAQNVKINEDVDNKLALSLTKVTKDVSVMIQDTNGEINPEDFDIRIADSTNSLEWNLTPKTTASFDYLPYSIEAGNIDDGADMTLSVLIARFSTFRYTADSKATLVITQNSDEVVRIPVVELILENKPNEAKDWSDQEYLDRKSDYRFMFFLNDK
ncbi:MAG: FimB/Mfa2 family fimbrial subunit [Muribaculaceae bacterium]|nr:FimB/Mfa2 family fimbrial subunit [Muribaculaceae bacterium]